VSALTLLESRIDELDSQLQHICTEFVEYARLVIPLDRMAVVLLQVDSQWCRVLFSWLADKKQHNSRDTSARFPEVGSASVELDPLDTSTMNIPLQFQGQLMGAVLLHSGRDSKFSPRARGLAYHLADTLANELSETIRRQEQPDNPSAWSGSVLEIGPPPPDGLEDVVHPLRSSLTAIKGYVSSLRQPDVTWPPELQAEFLMTIDQEADRLNRLVDDLISRVRRDSR